MQAIYDYDFGDVEWIGVYIGQVRLYARNSFS